MNNTFEKSVIACIALALVSLGSLEAGHRRSHGKKRDCKEDPIVGTWNLSFEARRIRIGLDETAEATEATEVAEVAEETAESGEVRVVLEGVGTFHKDGTVVFATIPKEPNNIRRGIFSTMSYGVWKRVGKGVYKVILSSVTNRPGRRPGDFRGKTCAKIVLIDDCEKACISGLFSQHPLADICFETRRRPRWEIFGKACKISLCDCKPRRQIAQFDQFDR